MNERSSVTELADILRREVERYPEGRKLPSSRALVERHQVSPVTVSRAIAVLAAEGLVVSRPGAGVFRAAAFAPPAAPATAPPPGRSGDLSWQEVALSADAGPRTPSAEPLLATLNVPAPGVVDLTGGYPHASLLPERLLAAALARAGRRPGAWDRPPVEGLPELRGWFARDIGGNGGPLDAGDVLITAGGQSALTIALRSLVAPGAAVLVESPTYPGTLAAARAAGLRVVPVPVDADGVRTDLLAAAFDATRARLFVCQPLFQNPTGAVLSAERRAEVLRIARTAGAFVVEDDFARRLAHSDSPALPRPLAADDPDGVVVHLRSLTKAASPNLRVGALTARGPARQRLRATQVVDSFFVSRPLQEAALELVADPGWARHLRTLGAELRDRRTATIAALRRELPGLLGAYRPGGYHLWLRLPDGTDETALTAAALRAGVLVAPGRPYYAAEPPAPHLRLSYAGVDSPAHAVEGVHRLRRAYDEAAAG
ncbi:PLP-dependent aminotransferase family protein [Kitasatospora sp. CM 4170]|uniref:PLP-dependent aminotransferase family protein n=1 Tax=Kitasatospora aburaviensis TaxID=67265 RepID=A0ABW1EW83_9ACTN|nr:PLP-dependent aminotransferase family protein [Kitasatospora sp. CM 4170]WNM46333.1 PLP-dependent aminotransferase family protein [Kitasatospora sp. CM 4170]